MQPNKKKPQKTFNNGRKVRNAPEEERDRRKKPSHESIVLTKETGSRLFGGAYHAPQNPNYVPEGPLDSGIERAPSIDERRLSDKIDRFRFSIFTAP